MFISTILGSGLVQLGPVRIFYFVYIDYSVYFLTAPSMIVLSYMIYIFEECSVKVTRNHK